VRHTGEDAQARASAAIGWFPIKATPEEADKVHVFMESNVGHGYSVAGFIAAGLERLTNDGLIVALDGQYICSGFVATALTLCGYTFPRDPRLMTPEELAESLGTINEGPPTAA
jgi:cell wall-associated NlpC family hydrolase